MTRKTALLRTAAGAVCALLIGTAAGAQEAIQTAPVEAGGVTAYPLSFFAQYKSSNVFEMVQHLPGFTFDGGADVRGFGGAAGNVLIDGDRPSSKSVPLKDQLQRISLSQVERIDVIRGGAPGIDMQGLPVIANVVRKTGAATTGAISLIGRGYDNGYFAKGMRLEGSLRNGGLLVEGSLGNRDELNPDAGDGAVSRQNGAGQIIQAGPFHSDGTAKSVTFTGAGAYRTGESALRLNVSASQDRKKKNERSDLTDSIGAFLLVNRTNERTDTQEVGGDFQRPLWENLTGQVIGLVNQQKDVTSASGTSRSPPQATTANNQSGERILRVVLVATPRPGVRLEGGGEGAFNFLDASSTLVIGGLPVSLPSDKVRVEERRGEAFATLSFKPLSSLSTEAGLRYERSTISQTGGANQEKTLGFLKPRLLVSWSPTSASQIRFRVERSVGQLQFTDFAANAELDTGGLNAGNPNLEPERDWTVETAFEHHFWKSGAAVLTLAHAKVESVVDLIPIGGKFDAPGNIGDGVRDTAKLSVSLPLAKLGLPGADLKVSATWTRSEVTDPVTGAKRAASYQHPLEGDILLTKSLPNLNSSIGFESDLGYEETTYRINEVRTVRLDPKLTFYWDWTVRPDLLVRFQGDNLAGLERGRDRTVYNGQRSLASLNYIEQRHTKTVPFLSVRVRKSF